MVVLNKVLNINIDQMKKNIINEIYEIIDHEFYYIDNVHNDKKEIMKNSIIKQIKDKLNTDNFMYRIMADNRCIYKHKYGKQDGHFCHKNITKNGDSKKYLCRTHNKNHVPNKKIKYNNDKNISIKKSIQLINVNKMDNVNNKNNVLIKNDIKNIKYGHLYNLSKKNNGMINYNKSINKIYIKNTKINIVKKLINLYNDNIICKYKKKDTCYNIDKYGSCNFKHINDIYLNEFLYQNNNLIKIH